MDHKLIGSEAVWDGGGKHLRVLRCGTRRDEVRAAARIIRLALGDVLQREADFRSFVLVVPTAAGYERLIDQELPEYGIPVRIRTGIHMSAMPRIRMILKLLRGLEEDFHGWTIDALEDVLSFGAWDSASGMDGQEENCQDIRHTALRIRHITRLARRSGITEPFDAEAWNDRIIRYLARRQRLRGDGQDVDDSLRQDDKIDVARRGVAALGRFVAAAKDARSARTGSTFRARLMELLTACGLAPDAPSGDAISRDAAAWTAFVTIVDEFVEPGSALSENVSGTIAASLSAHAHRILCDPAATWLPPAVENSVRVASLAEALEPALRHVHVLGLAEDAYHPSLDSEPAPGANASPERLLLRQLLESDYDVVLSRPTSQNRQHLAASPHIEDVLAMCGSPPKGEIRPLTPCELSVPLSARDALIAIGRSENPTAADRLGLRHQNVATLVAMEQARSDRTRWSVYDGYLDTDKAITSELLASRATDGLTVTELGEYAMCPMRFFFRGVLRLRENESPDPSLPPPDRGRLIHEAIEQFFHRCGDALAGRSLSPNAAAHEMQAAADTAFHSLDDKHKTLYWQEERRALTAGLDRDDATIGVLRAFVDVELADDQGPASAGFLPGRLVEASFGGTRTGAVDLPAYTIPRRDGQGHVEIKCRVDRVDLNPETGEFVVYDYKSGDVPSQADSNEGLDFQLPTYIASVTGHSGCVVGVAAAFYSVKDASPVGPVGYIGHRGAAGVIPRRARRMTTQDEFAAFNAYVRENTLDVDEHIRAGRFHLTLHGESKAKCHRCDYRNICRLDPARGEAVSSDQPRYGPRQFQSGRGGNQD